MNVAEKRNIILFIIGLALEIISCILLFVPSISNVYVTQLFIFGYALSAICFLSYIIARIEFILK